MWQSLFNEQVKFTEHYTICQSFIASTLIYIMYYQQINSNQFLNQMRFLGELESF